jgi:molybdate transport system substrate-binding protein
MHTGKTVAGAIILLAGACGGSRAPAPAQQTPALAVAAASDLRYALDELVAVYREEHPGAGVSVSYGSSGNLYAQLTNGGPYDLFLSADIDYPRRLVDAGLAAPDSLFAYANGRIALWVPTNSPLDLDALGLRAVLDPKVTRVAIANPEHAPYGRAAEAALSGAGLLDEVRPKLVLGENISQTLQFVQSGAADIGIVALSLALAPPVTGSGRYWAVPIDAHPPIEQGGAILADAARPDAAASFRALMTSDAGHAVLLRYGFVLPGDQPPVPGP